MSYFLGKTSKEPREPTKQEQRAASLLTFIILLGGAGIVGLVMWNKISDA